MIWVTLDHCQCQGNYECCNAEDNISTAKFEKLMRRVGGGRDMGEEYMEGRGKVVGLCYLPPPAISLVVETLKPV